MSDSSKIKSPAKLVLQQLQEETRLKLVVKGDRERDWALGGIL